MIAPVFYNDNDAYCAQWLRNLIEAGHLPAGDVDGRSIIDVRPADLAGYDECHFFAGIGGWPLALRIAGYEGSVWTGSCPCQPFSTAGRQGGSADERHLWPHWFRLIRECRPDTIFGEQVAGSVGFGWWDRVCSDLETLGYACGAAVLGAHSVGAPHIRQRLFWVANAECRDERGERRRLLQRPGEDLGTLESGPPSQSLRTGADGGLDDTAGTRCAGARIDQPTAPSWDAARREGLAGRSAPCGLADTGHDRGAARSARSIDQLGAPIGERIGSNGAESGVAHTSGDRSYPRNEPMARGGSGDSANWEAGGCRSGSAACGMDVANGQRFDGQPIRLQPGQSRQARLETPWSGAAWLPCLDGKARRVEPTVQPLAHGVPNRVGLLRGAGNAIVPQVAAEFVSAFLEIAAKSEERTT